MTDDTALPEPQQTILEHLRRSKEPVSNLEYQHRLTYDDPELTKEHVTRAINRLLALQLITVASTVVVDCERVQMLTIAEPPAPQIKNDPEPRKPVSEKTCRKLAEAV